MSDVNAWLADYYGTDKTASVGGNETDMWNLFKAAAAEDGINAEALDDEEIDALADYYLEDDDDLPPNWDYDDVEHYNYLDDYEKTAFVQFKEAEFLGQVMAHSMDAESEKLARARHKVEMNIPGGKGNRIGVDKQGRNPSMAAKQEAAASQYVSKARKAGKTGRRSSFRRSGVGKGDMRATLSGNVNKLTAADKLKGMGGRAKFRAGEFISKNPRAAGALAAAGGLGLAGGAYAAGRSKSAGAIETLATVKANSFLKHAEAGYDLPLYEGDAIDERAYELLYENGYGELL